MKNSSDIVENRKGDLPACSGVRRCEKFLASWLAASALRVANWRELSGYETPQPSLRRCASRIHIVRG